MNPEIKETKKTWKEAKAEWKDEDNVVIKSKYFNIPKLEKDIGLYEKMFKEYEETSMSQFTEQQANVINNIMRMKRTEHSHLKRWSNRIKKVKYDNK